MILMKTIKPKRLNDKVFRAEIMSALDKAGKEIKKDFQKTTATWRRKPAFEVLADLQAPGPTLLVGTDDEIYRYVSGGTRPHPIQPKRAKMLRFKAKYKAKTKPRHIGSYPGGASGDVVYRRFVMHPGTVPREFEETVRKKREKWFKRQMEAAMRRAAKKSGHGM